MALMLPLAILLLVSPRAYSSDKEDFRSLLKQFIEKDPAFKEVDFQTPLYEAQLKQGFSQLLIPKVSLSYGWYEQHNNVSSATAGQNYRFGSLTASYSLFSFGNDWNNYQATRFENRAQMARVSVQLMRRENEIGLLLLNYLKGSRNLDILGRILKMKESALDVSKKRFERGSLSREDYSKVELDVSNARGELLIAQQDFNSLMAQVQAYDLEKLPASYPWENELNPEKMKELEILSSDIDDLPQFKEVDYTLQANDYQAKAAAGRMLGNLTANFSRNVLQIEGIDDQYEWRTSLVYTLPLFDQFNQYTDYRRNDALRNAYEVRQRFEKRLAQKRQDAEIANLRVSWKNWMERREALKTSSRLYKGSLNQFNQGQLSVNELLVDQDRLLRTEQIANSAIHQLHGSVLNFCHSRGKAYVKGCF